MAYKLLYNDELLFDPYSDNIVTDAQLTSKYNNPDYFDFTVPITNDLYDKLSERSGSVKLFYDNEKIFDGIITSIDIDMDGNKSIKCSGPLDYLNDTLVRPYSTKSGESQTQAPDTVSGIFQWYIDQHNQHTMDPKKNFSVGMNQGAMLSENNAFSRKSDSLPTTWDEIKNAILEDHGGFIFVEYSGDSNILNLYGDIHESNAQIIDFGVNITDFSKVTDTADQYTAIRPSGYTPEAPKDDQNKKMYPITISGLPDNPFDSDLVKKGDIIYSISAVKRYGYKEYAYSNNDITDTKNLLKSAALILKTLMAPAETITVKAVDLALYMNGYKHLRVGQAVRIRSKLHSTDEYMMVNSIVLDINDPSNTEYEFGIPYDTLTGQQSSYLRSLNSSINSAIDSVAGLDQVSKDTAKKAEDAQNTANNASSKADQAQNTANNASSKADKAQNTANNASSKADQAQNTANNASSKADQAQNTANSANNAAEELKKKTAEIDKQVEAVSNAASAASAKADKVRTDLQAEVDANKKATDFAIAAVDAKADKAQNDLQAATSRLESSISTVDKKADEVRTDLTNQVQNVKSEMDTAVEAAQTSANKAQSAADAAQKAADKANASTADLDKTIKAVDAKALAAKQAAAEAQSKAENVASDLDSANAVIEQHTTELGELTTKVSNAVKKSDSALSVSTEAKQTATEASTTATSAYRDSQTALTQSTTATQTATAAKTTAESASKTATDSLKQSSAAVQTANQISTTLRTEYQTKADSDKIYATQSSLKQTSDSITASVSKTYATKDALSSLQNVADNAIESWRGTGVPTLTNKPASDWTTDADKKKHSGDLYYDKSTGKAYRFGSDDGVTYTWELNQDTDVTKALADASKAQTSANNAQASATAANTAAGKAQSTANTAVSNAATAKNAADAAQSSANKAQGDVDKLKIDIPETYATKSSLTQTAESITANVESVKTTANSAVTAASKAQQTADGISVNLTKNYQTKSQADTIYATKTSLKATSDSISAEVTKAQGTADGAVTAASKAQQTADAVTLNLSKNYQTKAQNDALYATKTSLKATSDSLSANITANAKTAQSAVDKATSLEANLNGFKTTVSQTYTTKSDFNNLSIGGTNLISGSKPNGKSGFFSYFDKVTDEYGEHAFRTTSASQNYPNMSIPLSAFMFNVEDVVSGDHYTLSFDLMVLECTYTRFTEAFIGIRNTAPSWSGIITFDVRNELLNSPKNKWVHITKTIASGSHKKDSTIQSSFQLGTNEIGNISFRMKNIKLEKGTKPTDWSPAPEDLQPAGDYATNSSLTQTANSIKAQVTEVSKTANSAMSKATTVEQTANGLSSKITAQGKTLDATTKTANEAKSTADSNKQTISQVKTTADGAVNRVSSLEQNLNGFKTTVSKTYQTKDGMSAYATTSALKQTSDSITAEVSKVSQTATGAMSKATTVEQTASALSSKLSETVRTLDSTVQTVNTVKSTADSNKATLTQVSKTASDALSRASSVEQNLNGFKTTVSQTYTTNAKTEELKKYTSRSFILWGANEHPKWVKLGHLVSYGDSSNILLHVYSGNGYNADASQNAEFEIFVKDGWQSTPSANHAFGVSVKRIRDADNVKVKVLALSSNTCDIWVYLPWGWWNGRYTLQGNYNAWTDGPNTGGNHTQDDEPNGTVQSIAYDTLSTHSYVDQTAKSVALGVVQNYKGSDGSGLATKSDITVAKNSITSTVAGTYATKSGVTQEISSKITQNNNSLDVKFATKTENQNAQNAANRANSNAVNAQSRVGNIEDCISLTSNGVRAGKRSNGVFTGVSALVNTEGFFDLLDAHGRLITRIDQHTFYVAGDNGVGSGYITLSQNGINITATPGSDNSQSYHIQIGKDGISLTSPDGTHMNCSAATGMDLETRRFGKLAIGPGGLQFTNDYGWGLQLSAIGWSLKWNGNHMIATGPTPGKLYIDGHEIVTR